MLMLFCQYRISKTSLTFRNSDNSLIYRNNDNSLTVEIPKAENILRN